MEKKVKRAPLIAAFIIIVSTIVFSVAYGDWQAKKQGVKVEASPVSSSTGRAFGRFVWTAYGPVTQNVTPDRIMGEVPEETVRFVNSNLTGTPSIEENLLDVATITAAKPDFVAVENPGQRDLTGFASAGYKGEANPANTLQVYWDSRRWERKRSGSLSTLGDPFNGVAHWLTFESRTTGRKISVMATSLSEVDEKFANVSLYAEKLNSLASRLQGVVVIGATINVNYASEAWNEAGFKDENFKLAATYDFFDTFGGGTTDSATYTVDYMLFRPNSDLLPAKQGKWGQSGEHDAVWSEWTLSSREEPTSEEKISSMILQPEEGNIAY